MIIPPPTSPTLSATLFAAILRMPCQRISARTVPKHRSAEQQVLDTDQARVDAEMAENRPAIDRILDDRFVATINAGAPFDKTRFVDFVLSDRDGVTSTRQLSDRRVVVSGTTAVLVETDTVSGTAHGEPYSFAWRLTAVYVREGTGWKALALHLVKKPPPKP